MLRRLSQLLGIVLSSPGTVPPDASTELRGRVEALERSEHIRAAEHADMVDRLDRLYKRISARIARDTTPEAGTNPRPDLGTRAPGESVLELRKKLGR